ncbi:MAG TPA: hypothetical protein VLC09_07095 [Polyangiaceae bacterium]|nr:hypothetical protein [Polyangiaceae bacterium]
MNPQLLIDAIVRQTTVLLAQLSTAAGLRTPLAHVADQIFLELAREIESQGVSRKVAADMFGMALRTYQSKVQRLLGSSTERDRTLWEGALAYVAEAGPVDRRAILERFSRDDPLSVGAVLSDLVQSGLLERQRAGAETRFALRTTPTEEGVADEAAAALVWVAVYRGASDALELERQLGWSGERLTKALATLRAQGRLHTGEDGRLTTSGVILPVGAEQGWEAAVFDHYQAMVTAITRKLNHGEARSREGDVVGGGTLTFELDAEHPLRDEARGLLEKVRADVNELWQRVREVNRTRPLDADSRESVSFYFGQATSGGDQE